MNHLKLTILGLLALFSAVAPAAAPDTEPEKSHILVYKTDGTIDTLLLNNVLDIYHSRQEISPFCINDLRFLRDTLRLTIKNTDNLSSVKDNPSGPFLSFVDKNGILNDSHHAAVCSSRGIGSVRRQQWSLQSSSAVPQGPVPAYVPRSHSLSYNIL